MVRDAQEHADEDKKRRDEVETRNQADALAFQAERTLRDLGDKVSAEDRTDVESKVSSLREALKGDDLDAIRSRSTELATSLQRVSTAAYQATGTSADGANGAGPSDEAAGEAGEAGAESGAGADTEEAVEGEFKEV